MHFFTTARETVDFFRPREKLSTNLSIQQSFLWVSALISSTMDARYIIQTNEINCTRGEINLNFEFSKILDRISKYRIKFNTGTNARL